jgi:hypothetical protein
MNFTHKPRGAPKVVDVAHAIVDSHLLLLPRVPHPSPSPSRSSDRAARVIDPQTPVTGIAPPRLARRRNALYFGLPRRRASPVARSTCHRSASS